MGQAVEDGPGEALGAEDLGPLVEGQVRGDDDRTAFVALRDDLEEQLGPCLGEWHEAQLIDDEQILAGEGLLKALQAALIDGLDEFMDESGSSGEANLQAPLAGCQPEAEGNVSLSGAAWSQRNDVLAAIDKLATREFHGQCLVERRDLVDDRNEGIELRPDRRFRTAIPWRHRVLQDLRHRLAVDAEHPCRFALAHPVDMARPTHPPV